MASSGADESDRWTLVTYNILARSLGSNCIPWVMTVDAAIRGQVDTHLAAVAASARGKTCASWDDVASDLKREYRAHFHRNTHTQSDPRKYHAMRALWSHPNPATATTAELPELASLRVPAAGVEGGIAYTDDKGSERLAVPMAWLLPRLLGDDTLAARVLEHVLAREHRVFQWPLRGPRLFQRAVGATAELGSTGGRASADAPGVVCLQEYDVHDVPAAYRGDESGPETFHAAMRARGYEGLFLAGLSRVSGVAVFWRRDEWELVEPGAGSASGAVVTPGDGPADTTVHAGESLGRAAFNAHFSEQWHPTSAARDAGATLMAEGDRRTVGLVRLRRRFSGRVVWIVCAHLMTTSRDCAEKTWYPGEIRAGELATLRQLVARHVCAGEGVVLAGDFNTRPFERNVWSGVSPLVDTADAGAAGPAGGGGAGSAAAPPIETHTGFAEAASGIGAQLRWLASDDEAGGIAAMGAVLESAFEDAHGWPTDGGADLSAELTAGAGGSLPRATSVTELRRDWIDYVWYSPAALRVVARSECRPGPEALPTETEPSDHVPLAVSFQVAAAEKAAAAAAL